MSKRLTKTDYAQLDKVINPIFPVLCLIYRALHWLRNLWRVTKLFWKGRRYNHFPRHYLKIWDSLCLTLFAVASISGFLGLNGESLGLLPANSHVYSIKILFETGLMIFFILGTVLALSKLRFLLQNQAFIIINLVFCLTNLSLLLYCAEPFFSAVHNMY